MAAQLHLAEHTLPLHLLFQNLEGLVDIVVADENLHVVFLFDKSGAWHDRQAARAVGAWIYRPICQMDGMCNGTTPFDLKHVNRGNRSAAAAAPPSLPDWPPSWTRKRPRSARSDWSCHSDKSPSAMASEVTPDFLRQLKSPHGRSWTATIPQIRPKDRSI
jgi:hypothetical protein